MKKKYRSRDYHGYLETVRSLPTLAAKIEYTWDNWKGLIIGIAFAIFFVVTMGVSIYRNSAPVYLHGAFVNVLSTDQAEGYDGDYLTDAFLREYLQIPEDDRTRISYMPNLIWDFEDTSEALSNNYNVISQLNIRMAAHEIDYFLLTDSMIDILEEHYSAYTDLRDFLTEEELERYADRLHYNEFGVPVAIDITGSQIVEKLGLVSAEPICLAWCTYIEEPEHMRPFFDFVMSTVE